MKGGEVKVYTDTSTCLHLSREINGSDKWAREGGAAGVEWVNATNKNETTLCTKNIVKTHEDRDDNRIEALISGG